MSGYPPPQQGGYPPQQGGYPPQPYPQQGGYPPQQGGYPPQPYPQQGGYPPQQGGYPPQPYPQQGGYPPQQGGYPPQPYPGQTTSPQQPGAYPPQQGAYPSQPYPGQTTSPQQPGAYPSPQQGAYPPQQPGAYPPQQPGAYPPQQPGAYPPQQPGAYPPQQPGAYPGYSPQQPGAYPPQQPGAYPPQQPGAYPPQVGSPVVVPGAVAGAPPVAAILHQQYMLPGQTPILALPPGVVAPGVSVVGLATYSNGYFVGWIQPTTDIKRDVHQLRHAMKGIGTDETTLTRIIANRFYVERDALKKEFQLQHGKDLVREIKSETSGNYELTLVAMLTEPAEYDCDTFYHACKGVGTNENVLIDLFTTRNKFQKERMNQIYCLKYNKTLESQISSECSGDFKRLMETLLQPREENTVIDISMVRRDVDDLYYAGEGKLGTDEKVFINILGRRSFHHIVALSYEYSKSHKKHTLEKAIESEFSGNLKNALLAIVIYARNPCEYFAKVLHNSMAGAGTNDNKLIRTVVYAQYLMEGIKRTYQAMYGRSLSHHISNDTSGDYKKLLLDIIN